MGKALWEISMLEDLELRKKGKIIGMVISTIMFFIAMIIVFIKYQEDWWLGLIFLAIGALSLSFGLLSIKVINKRIKELKELEELKNERDKKEKGEQNAQITNDK